MASSVDKIPLYATDGHNVVVETPRGSCTQFAYDSETRLVRAKKLLAMGFAFPFAFEFFPSTRGEDGDPLDVLILRQADLPMGSLVRCRLIGDVAIEESAEGEARRNERQLAVPLLRHQDCPPYELSDIPLAGLKDIEDFLVAYHAADGKDTRVLARLDKAQAESAVFGDACA